jgi:hypothetical protein
MRNKALVAATSEGRYWRLFIGPEKKPQTKVYGTSDNIYRKRCEQIQAKYKAKMFLI